MRAVPEAYFAKRPQISLPLSNDQKMVAGQLAHLARETMTAASFTVFYIAGTIARNFKKNPKHLQGSLRRQSISWLIDSLCGLFRIPFGTSLSALGRQHFSQRSTSDSERPKGSHVS